MRNVLAFNRLASNSIFNFFGGAFPFLVSFVCVPIFIEVIGAEKYGILSIFLISTIYLSFLDLGIPRAIVQRTARAIGGDDGDHIHPFASGAWLSIAAGVVSFCLVYGFGHLVIQMTLDDGQLRQGEIASSIFWLALAIPVVVLTNVLNGFLQASDGFLELNFNTALSSIVSQVSPLIVALLFGSYLPHLLAAVVLARVAMLPLLWASCRRRGATIAPHFIRRAEMLELLRFGGWTTVSTVVGPLMLVSDRYVIGAMRGAVPVTQYSVPFQLAQGLMTLPSAIQSALLPALASATDDASVALAKRGTRFVAVLMLVLVGCAILIVSAILPFLLRDAYVEEAADVARIVLLGVWANAVAYIPASQLQARGRVRFIAFVHLLELPPYVLALYFGVVNFGLVGAALAFTLRCVIDAVIFHRAASVGASDWGPLAAMFLSLVGCCLVASAVAAFSTAWAVSTLVAFFCIVGLGVAMTTREMRAPVVELICSRFRPD